MLKINSRTSMKRMRHWAIPTRGRSMMRLEADGVTDKAFASLLRDGTAAVHLPIPSGIFLKCFLGANAFPEKGKDSEKGDSTWGTCSVRMAKGRFQPKNPARRQ